MAGHLGVVPSTVWRLESGELGESGPVAKLLDLLEDEGETPRRRARRPANHPASCARAD
jgi:hypothetical protein